MWVASLSSNVGTWMQNVLLPVYILNRTDSTSLVGVMVFAQLGPLLFLSIPAGVIADRFDRRKWLIAMQLVQLAFSAALAPLAAADAPVWSIFLVALGVGVGNALNAPAWSAMLPTLVSKADLSGSVSLNSLTINGSRVVGPIIVAVLRSFGVSIAQIFLINAATYLFVVFALLATTIPKPGARHEVGWRALSSGIRIARDRKPVGRLLLTIFSFSLLSLPYVGLFPAVARMNFGMSKESTTYEWLYATWGLGASFGGLAIGTVFVDTDKRTIVRRGFFGFAILLGLFAVGTSTVYAFVVGALLGFAYFATTTSMNTIFQSRLADHERGRVMALWFMGFGGTVSIGNLIFGPIIDAIGARWVLGGGALWALFLAWWCDIERIDRRVEQQGGGHALQPDHTASFDEHGISSGQ
jgi:MFS family permease